jgi:hypothetical protein
MSTVPPELNLPQSVMDLVEMHPIEDIIIPIARARIPGVEIKSLIADDPIGTFVSIRRAPPLGYWPGDERFLDYARLYVEVFASDPNGEMKGAYISEAVRVALRDAARAQDSVPGKGTLMKCRLLADPVRKSDFANSSGPVQFADLPNGMWRYEAVYDVVIRRPR